MAIITLTTDLQDTDFYVGMIKGSILSQCPDATIVDITHKVNPYDILKAAYTVKNSYKFFPEGSIHIIGVSPEATVEHAHLAIKFDNHYFVGADNGVFSLIFEEQEVEEIIELNFKSDSHRLSFPTKDVFVKVACHIYNGGLINVLGRKIEGVLKRLGFVPFIDNHILKGVVVNVDSFGNVITNISEHIFNNFVKSYRFAIVFRNSDYDINRISFGYNEVAEGEKLALFNTTNHLEIAINQGKASKLLGLKEGDLIRVELYDN